MSLGRIEDQMSPAMAEFMQTWVGVAHAAFPTREGLVEFHEALKLVVQQLDEVREEAGF